MDVLPPTCTSQKSLKHTDYLVLCLFCFLLFGISVAAGRRLTGHESVLPQSAREMLGNHDWLIPRMGGLPWLERPPLPAWIVAGIDAAFGDAANHRVARSAPALLALVVILLVAGMAGRW